MLKKFSKVILAFAGSTVFALLLSTGCSESPKAPQAPAPKPVPRSQPTVTSAPTATTKPEEQKEPVYTYNPAGRRDPFMPLIVKEEKKARTAELPPLERYNISEFKLTGIVWGGFGFNAILEGPDGKGYFLRVGTVIGPNRGVVKRITQNSVVIEEKYRTFTGETQRKEIIVELKRKQEGTP